MKGAAIPVVARTAGGFQRQLRAHQACQPAVSWCRGKTAVQAWAVCDNVFWMFWWLRRVRPRRTSQTLVNALWTWRYHQGLLRDDKVVADRIRRTFAVNGRRRPQRRRR